MNTQLAIEILDPEYVDALITSLVRQGYEVYFNKDNGVYGTVYMIVPEDDLTPLKPIN